jgi:hypothetical protein
MMLPTFDLAWPPLPPVDRFPADHLNVPEQLFVCSSNGEIDLGGPLTGIEFP